MQERMHSVCSPQQPPTMYTIDVVKKYVYMWLLTTLHLLATLLERALLTARALVYYLTSSPAPPPVAEICAHGRTLRKRPQHLGFIVVESDICWQSLADLILWSLAYGIQYVSVFDRAGRVRAGSAARLRPLLESRRRQLFGDVPAVVRFVGEEAGCDADTDFSAGCDKEGAVGAGCGTEVTEGAGCISVALLSEADGAADMTAAARRLCGQVATGARSPESIDRHMFSSELLPAAAGWPDPALAIKLGPLRALLGYLPWQLRLTEVLDAPPRRPLAYEEFRRLLATYGGIQQRMGT